MPSHENENKNQDGSEASRPQSERVTSMLNRVGIAPRVPPSARNFVTPKVPRPAVERPQAQSGQPAPATPAPATAPSTTQTAPARPQASTPPVRLNITRAPTARPSTPASIPPARAGAMAPRPAGRNFVAPSTNPARPRPASPAKPETVKPAVDASPSTPEPVASSQVPSRLPSARGGSVAPRGMSSAASSSPLGASTPRAASRPSARPSAGGVPKAPAFHGTRRSAGRSNPSGGHGEPSAPAFTGRRRSAPAHDDGDPGPSWDDYGGGEDRGDYYGSDYDRGHQSAPRQAECPFPPDPEGFVPTMDWSFQGTRQAPPEQARTVGQGVRAEDCIIPTNSNMPTEYSEPGDGEIPVDIGLSWHLPRDQRHKHDLTPAEAGWQSGWGWFVPFDMEPIMPKTAPPPPSSGIAKIYSWLCSEIPPEIVARFKDGSGGKTERYLAECMALGRRPDIYKRYERAPAQAVAPTTSPKPTGGNFAPF